MNKLAIIGNGGFAREVEWLVERINAVTPLWDLIGFIDNDRNSTNVVGDDNYITEYSEPLYVAIAIGNPNIRENIYKKFRRNSYIHYANLIDPSVFMSKKTVMGRGNIICAGSILTVDIQMGDFNIINLNCTVGHDSVIHSFATISPNTNLSGHCIICDNAYIGTGTQIIEWRRIGKNSVIGAGSVVNKDIPDNCTAVGVPAKVIKSNEGVQ